MNYRVDLEKLEEIMIAHVSNPRNLPENLAELVRVGEPFECERMLEEKVDVVFNTIVLVFLIMLTLVSYNPVESVKGAINHLTDKSEIVSLEKISNFFADGIGSFNEDLQSLEMRALNSLGLISLL